MIRRAGLTLLELLVVLFILVALAGLAVPLVGDTQSKTEIDVTEVNMNRLGDLIINVYWNHKNDVPRPGSLGTGAGRPNLPQVRYLFINPLTETSTPDTTGSFVKTGWQGPYLMRGPGQYKVEDPPGPPPANPTGFTNDYGMTGDPAILDGWGKPIVIRAITIGGENWYCLVSAGPNQKLESPVGSGDDIVRQMLRLP